MTTELLLGLAALIGAVGAIGSPILVIWATNKAQSSTRQEQWDRDDMVAKQAKADAAAVLKATEAQTVVVEKVAEATAIIHTLVNSGMTVALESDLRATKRTLVLLKVTAERNELRGAVTEEVKAEILATEERIEVLRKQLEERAKADALVAQQAEA